MNKQVFRNSIVIWAALGMISLSLFGQPPAEDEGSDIPKPVRIMQRFLELTPDLVADFRVLRQGLGECVRPLRQDLYQLKKMLKEALESDAAPAVVVAIVKRIHAVKGLIRDCHRDYVEMFVQMLDPDQADKLRRLQGAARLRPVIHAFSVLGLLHAPTDAPETDAVDDAGAIF